MELGPYLVHTITKNTIPFNGASVFTIGRSSDCNLDISAIYISRKQCRIEYLRNIGWALFDESRFKTTKLNDEPINSNYAILKDGDKISFAPNSQAHEYRFHNNSNENATWKKRKLDNELTQFDSRAIRRDELNDSEKISPLDLLREMATQSSFTFSPKKELSEELEKLRKENVLLDLEIKKSRDHLESNNLTISILEMENRKLIEQLQQAESKNRELNENLSKKVTQNNFDEIEILKCDLEKKVNELSEHSSRVEKLNSDLKDSIEDAESEIENLLKERCCKILRFGSNANNEEDVGMDTLTEVELSVMKEDLKELTKKNSDLALNLDKVSNEKEEFCNKVNEIMDSELYCSICSDLIYQAITLQCKHTFCLLCIEEWKKKKRDCPVCRTKIKTQVPCLIIDNLIDKVVDAVGGEVKMRREELVRERTAASAALASSNQRGAKRRRNTERPVFQPYPPPLDPVIEQISGRRASKYLRNRNGNNVICNVSNNLELCPFRILRTLCRNSNASIENSLNYIIYETPDSTFERFFNNHQEN